SADACRRARPRPRSCNGGGRPSAEQPIPRIRGRRLLELLERGALRLRQLRGHGHAHAREQVAAAVALQARRSAALDAQELAVLRAGGNLERDAAVGGRDLDRRAERDLVEGHGYVEHEVVASPLVELRRLDARDDVEIAGGSAAPAGLALALQLDLRAVLD